MSVSLRDQRARIYGYDNGGDEGRISETYPYLGEYWTRYVPAGGREATIAAQAEQTIDGTFFFSDEIDTPPGDGLVKLGPSFYKTVAVIPARATREIAVRVVSAESAEYVLTGEP